MADARVLALDIGSSSVRACAFDGTGTAIPGAASRLHHELEPGGVIDPVMLLAAALAVEQELSSRFRHEVDTVGISCFWHSLLALDARGRPLTPLLTWRDVRSAVHADELASRLDAAAVHARTGCPLHASYWPAKLRWLAEEHPHAFRTARRFVGFADWLLLEATEELRTSVSMASATGLWTDGRWDAELLDAVGIEPDRLPPVGDEPARGAARPLPLPRRRSPGRGRRCAVGRRQSPRLAGRHAAIDLLHAGLEGVALELRRVADLFSGLREVVVSGGSLAANPGWLQIVADVLERPLVVSAVPEASVRGAAVHVLERLGCTAPAPLVSRTVTPRKDRAEAYRSALERHLRLMQGAK